MPPVNDGKAKKEARILSWTRPHVNTCVASIFFLIFQSVNVEKGPFSGLEAIALPEHKMAQGPQHQIKAYQYSDTGGD